VIKKTKPARDKKYLNWVRTLPCAICGGGPCQAAHQRLLSGGMGSKPSDYHAIPCCPACHMFEHNKGVLTLWNERTFHRFESKHELRDFLQMLCRELKTRYEKENE
jgi:hypothetical protein